MANEVHESMFNDVLVALVAKEWTPLMDPKDIEDANNLISKAAESQSPVISTASSLFNARGRVKMFKRGKQTLPIIVKKVDFYAARYNNITESDIRSLIPTLYKPNHKFYLNTKKFTIEKRIDVHTTRSLLWLYHAVKKIINNTNPCSDSCGWDTKGFFKELTIEQRKAVLGAVFDQYPLWVVIQLRKREARSVDFKQIWTPVNSPDRVALRAFYRLMFVEMGEVTYQMMIVRGLNEKSNEPKQAWKDFPDSAAVQVLNLGGPESLPMT